MRGTASLSSVRKDRCRFDAKLQSDWLGHVLLQGRMSRRRPARVLDSLLDGPSAGVEDPWRGPRAPIWPGPAAQNRDVRLRHLASQCTSLHATSRPVSSLSAKRDAGRLRRKRRCLSHHARCVGFCESRCRSCSEARSHGHDVAGRVTRHRRLGLFEQWRWGPRLRDFVASSLAERAFACRGSDDCSVDEDVAHDSRLEAFDGESSGGGGCEYDAVYVSNPTRRFAVGFREGNIPAEPQ